MNKMLCRCFFGLGLAVLLVTVAAAQENFVVGGVQGVRGLHGHAVLPPTATFSNCGAGCTSYNTGSGYYVTGTGISTGTGQTLAMGFSFSRATKFVQALTPNTVYTANGGASSGKMTAVLLNGTASGGPTSLRAKLVQNGTIPDYPNISTIMYTPMKTVQLKPNMTYFLCERERVQNVQLLWMLSNSDLTSPFWFQDTGNCRAPGVVWNNATGAVNGSAFEIN